MPLTKEEVLEKMKDPSVVLVNILPEEEFNKLHIKGSQNLVLGPNVRTFESTASRRFTKNNFIITYGADEKGVLGLNAAKLLVAHGFQANNYPGGLKEWTKAGLPTSSIKNPSTDPAPVDKRRANLSRKKAS